MYVSSVHECMAFMGNTNDPPPSNNLNGLCLMSADCVIGYAACVCACAYLSACVRLTAYSWGCLNVLFESVCKCVLHAAMWSCVPASCLQTSIPKTRCKLWLRFAYLCVHTHLFNTECVHKCMLDSPQVLFHFCLCDISMRVSVHLPVAISTWLLNDVLLF